MHGDPGQKIHEEISVFGLIKGSSFNDPLQRPRKLAFERGKALLEGIGPVARCTNAIEVVSLRNIDDVRAELFTAAIKGGDIALVMTSRDRKSRKVTAWQKVMIA